MAKLTAGITGWGRGAVAGVQMQTMRGKTFIRAKQPPLGPGNANQTAYRDKFSFIQHSMKIPDAVTPLSPSYYSSVPLDQRNEVLRQNLRNWPFVLAKNRGLFCDDYLWKLVKVGLNFYNAEDAKLVITLNTGTLNGVSYAVYCGVKHTDGTFRTVSSTRVSSGNVLFEDDLNLLSVGKQLDVLMLTIVRVRLASPRPYLLQNAIFEPSRKQAFVYGNFTIPGSATLYSEE